MVERRIATGAIGTTVESLRRELIRERLRLNEGNRWIRDFPREVVIATSVTLDRNDRVTLVDDDTAAGIVTVTLLPDPEDGQVHTVVKLGTTGNVDVSGNGKNINGSATLTLASQYESATVLFSAERDEWFVIGSGP